jgi:hypothetical protein
VDYEGFPTSEINYLQRLRILLEKESQAQKYREALEYYANHSNWGEKEPNPDAHGRKRDWFGNGWHGYSIAEQTLKEGESQ